MSKLRENCGNPIKGSDPFIPEQLDDVIKFIHDCWFSINNLVFDKENFVVRIYFEKECIGSALEIWHFFFLKRMEIPIVECILNIHDTVGYDIEDTEKVDRYDFNELYFDKQSGLLSVNTGIPLKLNIKVKRLNITVDVTSNVVATRKAWFFCKAAGQK